MQNLVDKFLVFSLLCFLLFACNKNGTKDDNKKSAHHKNTESEVVISDTNHCESALFMIDTNQLYYTTVNHRIIVVKPTNSQADQITGNCYVIEDNAFADPIPFAVDNRTGKALLTVGANSEPQVVSIVKAQDNFVLNYYDFAHYIFFQDENREGPIVFQSVKDESFTPLVNHRYKEPSFQVKVYKDVVYGHADGYWTSLPSKDEKYGKIIMKNVLKTFNDKTLPLEMDIYYPKNDTITKRPLFLLIHGGAFYVGDKAGIEMRKWCEYFSSLGYVTASINYRMGFSLSKASIEKCGFKAIQDAHAAMRYLVVNAEKYGIDTASVFVGGASAGAITALNMVMMTNDTRPESVKKKAFEKKYGNIHDSGNDYHVSFHVKAIANMWGAVQNLECINHARTPVISFHGTADRIVPYNVGFPFSDVKSNLGELFFNEMYGSRQITERLKKLGVSCELYPFVGEDHAPYKDKHGNLNEHFYFISDRITSFFLKELLPPIRIVPDKANSQYYHVDNDNVYALRWKVIGGFLLNCSDKGAKVVWFTDAPKHQLLVTGYYCNGAAFNVEKTYN